MLNVISGLLAGGVAASTNSYESIQTVTVGSGGSSSISFTSIPSTYKHLQIRLLSGSSSAGSSVNYKLNSDATATNYYYHRLQGDGSAAGAAAGNLNRIIDYSGTSTYFAAGVIDILDYANTSKNKTVRALSGYDANGSGLMGLYSNGWTNTSAITRIDLYPDAGSWVQYSQFALYGIKG